MDYTEITIKLDIKDLQVASDIAVAAVPYGFYIEDYSDLEQAALEIAHIDLIDEQLVSKPRDIALLHLYIEPQDNPAEAAAFLCERLSAQKIGYDISTSQVREQDWANNWRQFFKPTEIGERLLVLPEWEQCPDTDRAVLLIDPGAAFGTGTHATTRLCLAALDRLTHSGSRVLDIGCGSGILAIAAMLLGAKSALGVDIDKLAVKTAVENGKKNGLGEPEFTVKCGNLTENTTGKYDIIVANIVADAIIELSAQVLPLLDENGVFITSGIIDDRANEVQQALQSNGFVIKDIAEQGGWVCLTATKGE